MFWFLKSKEYPPPTHQDLMKALNFSDADLKANREGYMTRQQRVRLRRKQWGQAFMAWLMAGMMAFTIWIAVRPPSTSAAMNPGTNVGLILVGLMFAGLMCLFIWSAFEYQSQTKTDLRKGQVTGLSGAVYRKTYVVYTGKSAYRVYEIHLMGEVFGVSRRVFNAFVDDGSYDVFYAPKTKMLLSAERLS